MALEPGHLLGDDRAELGEYAGLADARLADEQERLSSAGAKSATTAEGA